MGSLWHFHPRIRSILFIIMQTRHGFVVVVVVVRPLLRSQSSLPPSPQIAARAWTCCCCCIVILGFCFCACSGEFFFNDGKPWLWAGGACGTGRQWTLPHSAGGDRRGSALQYAASCHQHCRWSVPTANLRPQDQEFDHVAGKKESGPSLGCGRWSTVAKQPWFLSEKLHCLRLCKPVLNSNYSRPLCWILNRELYSSSNKNRVWRLKEMCKSHLCSRKVALWVVKTALSHALMVE